MTRFDEILKFNKDCADLIGAEYNPSLRSYTFQKDLTNTKYTIRKAKRHREDQLCFDSDWNWLMEVVKTIEKLNFNVRITCTCITIENTTTNTSNLRPIFKFHSIDGEFETKEEAIVQAITDFLLWYNKNNENINTLNIT